MKKIKKSGVFLFCFLVSVFVHYSSLAQQQGKFEHAGLGLTLTIPDGWVGREMTYGFNISSYTEPGFILLTSHEYTTLDQLKAEARAGLQEANGTSLKMEGDIEQFSDRSIGAEFTGTVEWQKARSYIIGTINPYGAGVSILATAADDEYSPKLREIAIKIARSFKFTKADKLPIVEEWKKLLANARLTYIDSYTSGSDGYSSEEVIDLCAAGYFNYNQKNHLSIDNRSSYAYARGSGRGSGNWVVTTNMQNKPVLQLTFYTGEVYEYVLAMEKKKTILNGNRYFRTYQGEYAPQCF